MLSYQHIYHAGCLADVHKHAALCLLLNQMVQKDKAITYVETHAGRGLYDLSSLESQKTGEAKRGIERLLKENIFDDTHIFKKTLNDIQIRHGSNIYAGSPALAQHILRPNDQITLMELHPQEYAHLSENVKNDRRVQVRKTDGYQGLMQLDRENLKRGFVFIDPSYEIKSEYEKIPKIIEQLKHKWPVAVLCIWYPLLPASQHISMIESLNSLNMPKTYINETEFNQNKNDNINNNRGMFGSGLYITNLPYGVEEDLNSLARLLSGTEKIKNKIL